MFRINPLSSIGDHSRDTKKYKKSTHSRFFLHNILKTESPYVHKKDKFDGLFLHLIKLGRVLLLRS